MTSHVAGAHAYDCKCDRLWVRFPLEKKKNHFLALVSTQSEALSSFTQLEMAPEFRGKWGIEVS